MRRFKAIYLAIILAVLWIGAGCAAYFLLLSPQFAKNKGIAAKWDTANTALAAAQTTATTSASTYPTNAAKLIENYRLFHTIQATMPKLYDMKTLYSGKESEGLKYLYQAMGHGAWIRELKQWTRGYGLQNQPYVLSGTLGYEPTLTSVRMVTVPFGTQTFTAVGYADLINKVRNRYGYKHFPLVISGAPPVVNTKPSQPTAQSGAPTPGGGSMPGGMTPGTPQAGVPFTGQAVNTQPPTNGMPGQMAPAGGTTPGTAAPGGGTPATPTTSVGSAGALVITVNRDDPRYTPSRPILKMSYDATGALFTRGWDPNQATIAGDIQNAKSWMAAPPAVPPVSPPNEFPKILFFFGGRSEVK